jgi:putative transposase
MRGPKPPLVELSAEERQGLEALARRHTTPQQIALRARIILSAADGFNNARIARQLGVNVNTASLWRNRWLGLAAASLDDLGIQERLTDAPRPGAPARITPEQVCQIVSLACQAPSQSERPISQWTGREIADEVMKRGIVEQISPRHAGRLLQRGTSNPTWYATG